MRVGWGAALLVVLAVACSPTVDEAGTRRPPPSGPSPVRTLSPLPPLPDEPPTGELRAEVRQSSRDVALGRMQVWIANGTVRTVRPRSLRYRDRRFRRPLVGSRLRPVPAGSERGFPLTLPRSPRCGAQSSGAQSSGAQSSVARLSVRIGGRREEVPVDDPTGVAERYRSSRCLERQVSRVARLRWLDDVAPASRSEDRAGTLVLDIRPTGRRGTAMRLLEVGGTPLLGPVGTSSWPLDEQVRGTDGARQIVLEVRPVRCDGHAFAEAAGATAFRIALELDGRRGSLLLRMSPEGTSRALAYARDFCGPDGR